MTSFALARFFKAALIDGCPGYSGPVGDFSAATATVKGRSNTASKVRSVFMGEPFATPARKVSQHARFPLRGEVSSEQLAVSSPAFRGHGRAWKQPHCLLLTAYCLLLTAHCSLLTAHCLPLTAHR